MNASQYAAAIAESLLHAEEHYQTTARPAGPHVVPPFTIAVSRQVGARGTTVAREVGQRLGWPVYDQELLQRIADELHVRVSELSRVDERPLSWVEEWAAGMSVHPIVGMTKFADGLRRAVLALAARGNCVLVGRGSPHILPAATTLRVRLVAPREDRTAYMARERNMSHDEAARFLSDTDAARAAFVRENFAVDGTDPAAYDLVLNASVFPPPVCTDLVIAALRHKQAAFGQSAARGRPVAVS
jgi:cytidylate kinase